MGEFSAVAEELLGVLRENEGLLASAIPDYVGRVGVGRNGQVNCYPGLPGAGCHEIAFFVSLTSNRNIRGRKGDHLTFRKAIEKFVQHMQGHCPGVTRAAVIIADSWDPEAFDEWRFNVEEVKKAAHVEAYLISGLKATEMKI